MPRAYIGLGSNLGDPRRQVREALKALDELPHTSLERASSLYCSAPMGPQDQLDYINAVAALRTDLEPLALLDALQAVENTFGRVRTRRWGERTLDLDLLLYDDAVIRHERLTVPHYGMPERAFVLYPLAEIAADLVIPGLGPLQDLLAKCPADGLERCQA